MKTEVIYDATGVMPACVGFDPEKVCATCAHCREKRLYVSSSSRLEPGVTTVHACCYEEDAGFGSARRFVTSLESGCGMWSPRSIRRGGRLRLVVLGALGLVVGFSSSLLLSCVMRGA